MRTAFVDHDEAMSGRCAVFIARGVQTRISPISGITLTSSGILDTKSASECPDMENTCPLE